MIKFKDYYRILYSKQNNKEKIIQLVGLLDNLQIIYQGGKIWVNHCFDDYLLHSSSLIVPCENNKKESIVEKYIQEKIQQQQVVDKICQAIASICLDIDRDVFIERYIFHLRIKDIKKRHYLSNNGYYQCLESSFEQISSFFHLP